MEATLRRVKWQQTIGYFAAFVGLGLVYTSLGPTLTDLAANTGSSLEAISYVFTARGLGYLAGTFLGGRLYDRWRGNVLMAGMLVLCAAMMGLIPLLSSWALLIGAILLIGMFEGAVDVGGNTLLVWVHGNQVDAYMNALHFFFGVGASLAPFIIAQVIELGPGFQWSYWTLGILVLPVAAFVASLPSPRAPAEEVISDEAGEVARRRRAASLVTFIAIFFFLYVGGESIFGGWIATYAQATGLGDAATAAYLTSVFWGALTVGRLLSIPLAARFAPRQVLLGDLVGCLVSVAAIVLWPGEPLVTWVGTFGAGVFMASIFPTTLSLAERNMRITGATTAWFFVGGSLGGMSLPWLIGQLFESIGPRVTMLTVLVAVVLNLVVYGVIRWVTR